jgi:CDP-glucose 4,6-dehydratase
VVLGKSALESVEMRSDFWKGRRVLVTGHTGFKGSWLALWLQHMGAEVFGYALPPATTPSLFDAAGIGEGMESHIADIRDLDAVRKAFSVSRPAIVLHLAAQALVRESYCNPIETYAVNVMGTANVLEASRQCDSVRAIVVVTSDKCYANREWVWGYREDEPMGGHDPYSSSKGCAELVTASYAASFFAPDRYAEHGVAVGSARAGNVVGGGDWARDRLLPDIVRAFQASEPVVVRNPGAIRPWQHVLEPLRGYLELAEALHEKGPAFAGGWNFGPGEEDTHPVSWIVERAARIWGDAARWELDSRPQPHEAHYLKLDCSKARALLAWSPAIKLPAALDSIMTWYRSFYQYGSQTGIARTLTLTEISSYRELIGC